MVDFIERFDRFFATATCRTGIVAFLFCLAFKVLLLICFIKAVIVSLWNGNDLFRAIFVAGMTLLYFPAIVYGFFYIFTSFWAQFARNVFFVLAMPFLILFTLFNVLPTAGYTPPKSFVELRPEERAMEVYYDDIRIWNAAQAGDKWYQELIANWERWNPPYKWNPDKYNESLKAYQDHKADYEKLHANDTETQKILFKVLRSIGLH